MFQKTKAFFGSLLHEGGPSSNRLINLGVFVGFTTVVIKLSWICTDVDKLNIWFWAVMTTYAVYGMGTASFNKWLDIVKLKAGGTIQTEEVEGKTVVTAAKTTTTTVTPKQEDPQ